MNSPFKNLLNRPIIINGDFYQHCYDMAIDSVNVIVNCEDNNSNKIVASVLNGLNQEDALTKKQLYYHLRELNIKKTICINTNIDICEDFMHDINTNYNKKNIYIEKDKNIKQQDLLIVDTNNIDNINRILKQFEKFISKGIIVKTGSIDTDNLIELHNFVKEINTDYVYYEYIYKNEDVDNLNYQYELIEYIHAVFSKYGVKYCAIKDTCLGCVRNRSHIISRDMTICRLAIGNALFAKIKNELANNYGVVITRDLIYFKKKPGIKVYVEIYNHHSPVQYCHDFINKDFSNIRKYRFGPIEIFSLIEPIEYLKNLYGNDIFISMRNNIKNPKIMYDCKYNYWSSYTSQYWKNKQIELLKSIHDVCIKYKIPYWIDGGTLLGAVRNRNIPLFDDDIDIGLFKHHVSKFKNALKKHSISLQYKIKFMVPNSQVLQYKRNDNAEQKQTMISRSVRNWDRELNSTYATGRMSWADIIEYYAYNNTYISNAFNWKKERMLKTAVPTQIFNNITTIKLGKYYFNCPENPVKYLESKQRYGTNSIQSPAKRGAKPLDFQNCQ